MEPDSKVTPAPEGEIEVPVGEIDSPDGQPEAGKEQGKDEQPAPEDKVEEGDKTPQPLDQGTIEAAIQSPQGQQLVLAKLRELAQAAQSQAEARATVEKARTLIKSGDFESLGQEYAKLIEKHEQIAEAHRSEQAVAEKAREHFYGNILPGIAEKAGHAAVIKTMTEEEKWAIHPDNPKYAQASDEEYTAVYLSGIEAKRAENTVETKAKELFEEWKKAKENEATGGVVGNNPPETPPGVPGAALPNTARGCFRQAFASPTEPEE